MTRALVIRTYGDPSIAAPIANTLSRPNERIDFEELRRLRAEFGVKQFVRQKEYKEKIEEARIKYTVKPATGLYSVLLSAIGLALILSDDIRNSRKKCISQKYSL